MGRLIVAGSRDFTDYDLAETVIREFMKDHEVTEIVGGGARGADALGKRFAETHGIPYKEFPADWNGLGKRAGYVRNVDMAEYSDMLIAFWDYESKGTKHMINIAFKRNLITYIKDIR